MTGLPRSIIKKYGVSKKAWAVFRGTHSRAKSSRARGTTTMAKRKGFRRARRSSGFGGNEMSLVLASALYGAARPYIGSAVQPLSSKLPLGGYETNVVLGGGAYLLGRYVSNGYVKTATKAILLNEAFLVGAKASQSIGGQAPSQSAGNAWV